MTYIMTSIVSVHNDTYYKPAVVKTAQFLVLTFQIDFVVCCVPQISRTF